jgi:ADP-heptose:LPS heptosyltransferase
MKIAFLSFGALGDCAYSSCLCHRLRVIHPDAEITWIIFDLYKDFVANNPDIDNYIAWPLAPGQTRQQQEVQRWKEIQEYAYHNFDLVVRAQCWPWDNLPQECLWDDNDDRTIFDHQLAIANLTAPEIGSLDKQDDRNIVFKYSDRDAKRAILFLSKNNLWDSENDDPLAVKPFICITPFANTVGNQFEPNDYKYLLKHFENVVYFGGKNNQEIPWAIDGRGTLFGEMVAIAEKSIGIIGLESGPTYLMSILKKVPLVVLRNPYSFPLHKQGLVKCGFRTENIKEIVVMKEANKSEVLEEAREFIKNDL